MRRVPGDGWLVLIGGGEFSFGETQEADAAWVEKLTDGGSLAFIPAASGSSEYAGHLGDYLSERFDRRLETVPIYRRRDARRGKNIEKLDRAAGVYIGGGVTDHLVDALADEPALEALARKLGTGGTVITIAAAAQAAGVAVRSLLERTGRPGFGWLPGGVVEPNFDPGHDRRLRELFVEPGVQWGLGIPAGSAVLLGPEGAIETVGPSFFIRGADADIEIFAGVS